MQIIIDIDEEDYDDIMNGETKASALNWSIFNSIRNGVPLPKGHGDLIDRNELKKVINQFECYDQVLDAPTIIEADKGE